MTLKSTRPFTPPLARSLAPLTHSLVRPLRCELPSSRETLRGFFPSKNRFKAMRCDHSTFVQGARHNQLRFRHLWQPVCCVLTDWLNATLIRTWEAATITLIAKILIAQTSSYENCLLTREKKTWKKNRTPKRNMNKVTKCLFPSLWRLLERYVSKEIRSSSSSVFVSQLWNHPPTTSLAAKWGLPNWHIFAKGTHCLLSITQFCTEKTKMIFNSNRTKVVSRPSIMRFI